MLSTFLIALREGLEAALIVSILVAYVVKTGRRNLLAPIWTGVGIALAASFALGGFLSFTSAELSERGEQFFAGTTSFIAVGLVTWMVFWMKRAARTLRDELHGKVDNALTTGPLALATAAFFAVAFGHQCDVLSANGLGEGSASRIPCGVIRVGKRANGIDEGRHIGRISATRDDRRKHSHGGDGGRTLQKLTTL